MQPPALPEKAPGKTPSAKAAPASTSTAPATVANTAHAANTASTANAPSTSNAHPALASQASDAHASSHAVATLPAGAQQHPSAIAQTPAPHTSPATPDTPKAHPTPAAPAADENFAFVRDAQRRAFWRKPQVRAGLLASIVAGLLALSGQWAYHHRSALAARMPLARATFEALRWQVPPWQNIEAIEIEDSDFLKNPDNSYQLRVSLRNSSPHPVAMPALELAVLDDDEQVVAQRVVASDPALPMPAVIPPRGQWDATTEVLVQLPPTLAQHGISGYRVAVFYP